MSRSLRSWQSSCITKALEHFAATPHFFCQATPGAGKTRMAAELASRLLELGMIDLVLCFAPSCQIVEGIRSTFAAVLGRRLDGQIGAVGAAYTYQAMEYRDEGFWQLLTDFRVLAVFDEIHHCAGHDPLLSNAWGQQILHRIQDRAAFTLALSGTPWRSDDKAIALARYSSPEGHLICDYRYGLKDAIADGVCRSPRIVLLDNQKVKLTEELGADSSVRLFPSIAKLLGESPVTYEELLRHDEVINPILDLGCNKLNELRQIKPDAAGLVVATDIEHAQQVAQALEAMGEVCRIVTNKTPDAQQVINAFRSSSCRWIVAVGMISEGTDIPRLQVCCYLSRIRTELHYRQVLGRVLRRAGESDDQAWLFMLAEPTLQGFAERIADDLPDDLAVLRDLQIPGFTPGSRPEQMVTLGHGEGIEDAGLGSAEPVIGSQAMNINSLGGCAVEPTYQVSFSQLYRQQLLACF
ncbi:DEAD/DEAH box helicase family protein [Pseudomonas aeruginosa]|uniref:DEAD/DEAH box helicase n=2 Tax=Gammaproteobacteria TaxID=1236 RepID=UPI00168B267F|nr:DEAD/DEAH box helicase family protein [Pseudomonas aeruginosa]MBD3154710.1 DEAD/DEAH box helicase family protein [Pseudomonas aeruginosa]MCM8577262.1 DEAD/DEAH box helicase family protein [Pseudomonas aeruginosa]HDV4112526.1 DEAD/DEAH box helicase family protein [Pseudomonas aeruginosa]HDV4166977.1 DEAD/DEAH box helicase family protein [Pseudomonas aeruginosa]HDV4180116.1 DEAD/DEAH box helicase family protein [Pseudomonas aeruginosa]